MYELCGLHTVRIGDIRFFISTRKIPRWIWG